MTGWAFDDDVSTSEAIAEKIREDSREDIEARLHAEGLDWEGNPAPSFDDVEAVGLDGTLRFMQGTGPMGTFTWADIDDVKRNLFDDHASNMHDDKPNRFCAECNAWRERWREDANAALAGAVAHLYTVLGYAETFGQDVDAFAEYPRSLPSFDELTAALSAVELR